MYGQSESALAGVAAGSTAVGSTQAINGGQLNTGLASVATNLGGGSKYNPVTGTVTAPSYTIGGAAYNNVGGALGAVDSNLTTLNAAVTGGAGIKYFHANSTLADSSATGTDSVAIGPNAVASANGSVALGSGATASRGAIAAVLDPLSLSGATVTTTVGEISVGTSTTPRQITNVAAGTQANDAVNVGQILPIIAAQNQLGTTTAAALGGGAKFNAATGAIAAPSYTVGSTAYNNVGGAITALDKSVGGAIATNNTSGLANPVATGTDATAISPGAVASGADAFAAGKNALASGAQATSVGPGSQATGAQSTAVGTGAVASAVSTTALGDNAKATAADATALGQNTLASGLNSTATGFGAQATGDKSLASGNGAVASGTGGLALGSLASSSGANSVALGAGSTDGGQANVVSVGAVGAERKLVNVAAGALSATSTDAVNGSQLNATNTQVASLGHSAVQYAVDPATGKTKSQISLASDAGGPVVIHNLAPGVLLTDAANVSQINKIAAVADNGVQYDKTAAGGKADGVTLSGGTGGPVTLHNITAGIAATDAVNLAQLQAQSASTLTSANAYTDQKVNNLAALTTQGINEAKHLATAGTALALAGTGLRYDDRPGRTSIGGATSYYKGDVGLAFGIGHTSQDQTWRTNLSVNGTPWGNKPEVGVVVGATYSFN